MIEIEIKIDKDFKKYTKKEQKRLLRAIQELLSLDTNIRISKIRAGSVLVTLELPENYAKKLLEHIKAGKLRQFDVLDAELPSLRPMPVIADDLAKTTELLETSPQSQPKLISTSSPLQRLRLLLVERDGGTIHAVKTALENDARLEYVGYITSRSQVERQFSMDVPDVVLVDVSLVQHNVEISFEEGLAAISLITQISPATRVIGFSNFFLEHPSLVKAALQRGAAALIAKQNGPADWEAWSNWLRFQVLSVIDGYFEFSPEVARLIEEEEYVRRADLPDDPLPLTERQLEVLHLFASGLTDEEIGKKLRIVRGAVRGHISNIKDRLHLRYRWEVLEEARRRKLGQGGKK